MQIKILVSMVGPLVVWNIGDIIDIAEDEALRLIAAEYAEPVSSIPLSIAGAAIPDDWMRLHHLELISLAKKFDATVSTKVAATAVIEAELASRKV